jgi:hypothetical protein
MTDLFGNKIVQASQREPANDIIKRAGIKTTGNLWEYKGKRVQRPNGLDWEKRLTEEFNIVIKYTDL